MQIDTHVHFWKYNRDRDGWITDDMKLLRKDYVPQTILQTLSRNEIDGCVAVQVEQAEVETLFLVELAKSHSIIKGVVGWVDLCGENIIDRLTYFSKFPIIRGWRHIAQSEPNDFLGRADFQRGIAALESFGFTYDILIYHYQLQAALDLVAKFPGQKFVIDHCAKPDIAHKKIDEWRELIRNVGGYPNVYCKLSGLLTEAEWKQWSPRDFYPYLDTVFEAFGPDRLMFGSDWPVMLLSGIYVQWKSLLEKYMETFSEDDRAKVFGETAMNFYGL